MPYRKRSSRRSSGRKAQYKWIQNSTNLYAPVADGVQALVDLLDGIDKTLRAANVIRRMIIRLSVRPALSGTFQQWDHYILPMDLDAFAAGAVPEGVLDIKQYYLHDQGAFIREIGAGPQQWEQTYDIRTSRKLPGSNMGLIHVFENTTGTAGNIAYNVNARILLQLP